jgi:hypothetical protein
MKFKIDRRWKAPERKPNESLAMMGERLKKESGLKTMRIPGGIGHSGTKVHNMVVEYVELDDGRIGIFNIMACCGSAKWGSSIYPHLDTDLEVTCKKCPKDVVLDLDEYIRNWKKGEK